MPAKKKRPVKKTKNAPDFIHQFVVKSVRGQKRTVAVFVGRLDETGDVRIGWSKANISAGDKFDRKFGLDLALERTKADGVVPVPHSISENAYNFQDRCGRYFKDANGIFKIAIQEIKKKDEAIA